MVAKWRGITGHLGVPILGEKAAEQQAPTVTLAQR